ncbi:MAG TPA: AMP-binding protein [Bryobacteraceae bacterium]|nr:AMP-binding protein [Bryobacteraceae bacterium]
MNPELILNLVAARDPRAPVLHAPGRRPLDGAGCLEQVERTVRALRQRGARPESRVAVVLPNGPELAVSFLAVSAAATFAPLNPQYPVQEFLFYLKDLGANVLITEEGFCPAAETAAAELGLPIWRLQPQPEQVAGRFLLDGPSIYAPVTASESVHRESIAMLLHSSGTTARPKLIPLTQANLCASAKNIARTLQLGERDLCLNVMPLFHIHGLIGALLSSVASGAAVFATPGFNAFRFTRWMKESGATWTSAVPSMYQALLARVGEQGSEDLCQFRFLRTGSSHIPAPVWQELESIFDCPVLNTYGMTEASHQMASNLLPPRIRKIGTVGPATGPEIAVMGEDGSLLPAGCAGEVVIRGETVTRGYLSPPSARETAFRNGWFRTGDEGRLDNDGYLTLIGRLKEMINVAGEKVAPAEVDEILLQHPAVGQASAFGVPCSTMGERVYAAVVLRGAADERELRRFVRDRLAKFKVPEKILIVDEIPKGATGKVQRVSLAARLGVAPAN